MSNKLKAIFENKYFRGWVSYFVVLVTLPIVANLYGIERWTQTLVEAASSSGYGDPTYFAAAAIDISKYGWITENTRWVINLWPPGFVFFEGALLRIFGIDSAMPLVLLACSAGLFSTVLMEMCRLFKSATDRWAWLTPLVLFSFPAAQIFLLSVTGLVFGEWLAIGCFFGGVLFVLRKSVKGLIMAGFLFAISAYARSQYEFFLDAMLAVSVGFLVLSILLKKPRNSSLWNSSKYLVCSLIAAQIFMSPWRAYHWIYGQDARWVYSSNDLFAVSLTSDENLLAASQGWLIRGGANIACHISPEDCGKKDGATYKRIFLNNAYAWVSGKAALLPEYWFSSERALGSPLPNNVTEGIFNSLLLFCLIASCLLHWLIRKSDLAPIWIGISLSLAMAHVVIVVFATLEVRYLYFIKIYGVFSFLLLAVELMKQVKTEKISSK